MTGFLVAERNRPDDVILTTNPEFGTDCKRRWEGQRSSSPASPANRSMAQFRPQKSVVVRCSQAGN